MRKFDYVTANPPYNRGMDQKILKETIQFGKKIVFIMTERSLYRHSLQKYRDIFGKYLTKVLKVQNCWKLFKINHHSAEVIYVLDKDKRSDQQININDQYEIKDINQYNRVGKLTGQEAEYVDKIRKIKKVPNNIYQNCTLKKPPKEFKVAYYLKGGCNNGYRLANLLQKESKKDHVVYPDTKLEECTPSEERFFITFENEQEVENFKYSYRQLIFRWYLSNFKPAHTISKSLLERIPLIKTKMENEDWIRYFGIPQSLATKIFRKYSPN